MTTLELAKAKWARKMANAGPNWKRGVSDKASSFASGMARFLGLGSISGAKTAAWQEGTNAVTADEFAAAVRGKESRWADKLRDAFR